MTPRPPTNAELKEDIDALRADVQDLVKAWQNATFLVATVKWLATAFTAISAFVYIVTHFGQGK